MATIPMGNYGQAVARPSPLGQVPMDNPIAQAADRTLQIGGQVVNDMAQRDTQLDEQRRRAQAALTLAKTSNDMTSAHDEVTRGVMDGSIPADKASTELQGRLSKIKDANLQGYMPEHRELMDAHLTSVQGGLDRSLSNVVFKRQQEDTAGTIDQFGEQVSREVATLGPAKAAEKFGAMVDFAGSAAGLNPEKQAKVKQQFTERAHYNFFESAGTAAVTQGNADALGELVKKVQGPEGEALDPTKRSQLSLQLFGWQQHVLAKQARASNAADDEARQRLNEATDVYNKALDVSLSGGYFSPDFIKQLTTSAAGTPIEHDVASLIGSQARVAGFASKPAPERAAILEQMRAARATPGVGTDPAADKLLTAATTMDKRLQESAKENAWSAAEGAGVITSVAQINPANPQEAVGVIQQRMQQIGQVEAWAGHKVSPLQPQEVEQIGKIIRALPLDQSATMLANIGNALGDADRVAALAKQMGDKDGTLGLAMMYANAKSVSGKTTAELVLRGAQAEKDGTIKSDRAMETGWKATIAKEIRGLYSNIEVEDQAIRSAYLITGALDGDTKKAIALATGGIIERNGAKLPLPYGMKESDFGKAIEAVTPETLAPQAPGGLVFAGKTPIPLDAFVKSLPSAQLVHAGQGLYNVRAGTTPVVNAKGQRITIKVTP